MIEYATYEDLNFEALKEDFKQAKKEH